MRKIIDEVKLSLSGIKNNELFRKFFKKLKSNIKVGSKTTLVVALCGLFAFLLGWLTGETLMWIFGIPGLAAISAMVVFFGTLALLLFTIMEMAID